MFKYFSIFSSGGYFVYNSRNHLSNVGRGYYGEHLCEIILLYGTHFNTL